MTITNFQQKEDLNHSTLLYISTFLGEEAEESEPEEDEGKSSDSGHF
jgi:hypothetical protein